VVDIVEGRENPNAWIYVVEVAILAVYGQTRFDINVRSNRSKDFDSVSDEAFARLILLV
jgi:hypothetical protein